ncbi:MAG TPA: acyl-CoA reductase [Sediminibacterium sp.]|uniref:acyl-CoA reductase n=1 Tax=Sediminibacterium sp. TaxID=1917865 RepID=UPI000A6338EF|nr:acyl-CoA reductase [Sediminibacterium sp.]HLD53078.1 acyl-CoA reductase [Sediminibacterium sp.]
MNNNNISLPSKHQVEYLVGDPAFFNSKIVLAPFNETVIEFLSELSRKILSNSNAKRYPDVITFGYWCRSANLKKMLSNYPLLNNRKGVGIVFHIAPSNVPVNFAFSYVFSLLSGNISIVRVPTKPFEQVSIISTIIDDILKDSRFDIIRCNTYFIRYQQNDSITEILSSISNARIIWGSDETVNKIKSIKTASKTIDIPFSERYSFAIFGADAILAADELQLKRLIDGFFNDTYLMDQNACSSPQLILWYSNDKEIINSAKQKFWNALLKKVNNEYELAAKSSVDKLTLMCMDLVSNKEVDKIETNTNFIYKVDLKKLPDSILRLQGKYGYFYQYSISDINEIAEIMEIKIQTLTYFGIEKKDLFSVVYNSGNLGIDRIVPVGSALDIGIIWDGFDMIYTLSRIIDLK